MKHLLLIATPMALLLTGCLQSFKKESDGIEYKIISDKKGTALKPGNFFEIQFSQVYKGPNKDTVLFSSTDFMNQIVALDSMSIPPVYYKIFSQVRQGDSVVVKQLTDSIMKQQANVPPFMKKGAHLIAYYKVVNVFASREAADSAYQQLMASAKIKDSIKKIDQLKKDDKLIADYLAKNNITALKGAKGTYVQVLEPGEGDTVDSSSVLKVMYTGRLLEGGKAFDSNVDPQFGHTDPLPVDMSAPEGSPNSVIAGWTDGLALLKKGARAKLFIPSSLAYGARGAGNEIKPNANLVFDVEVADVLTQAQAKAEAEIEMKKRQAEQKRMMDSLQKAQKDTLRKK
ncbi:MAG TPA: FKBP-type peptidyl-prolyl cis-trans isomerase [Ferruginibacter sp.]|nr:FKBP-type peptidyl-prolyl cis-trans isomerase [Ferruginibacter sp.]HMP22419.1 FKBP-type peptidyl-prolyl cis-trans isomerase [Ferruginibacter sp.]